MGDNMKHFCASAFIINPETKKILLVKHSDYDKWVQPGGHIEDDETPEEAAVREVFEETGLKITLIGEHFPREEDLIRPLGIQCNRKQDGNRFIDIIYAAKPNNPEENPKLNDESTSYNNIGQLEAGTHVLTAILNKNNGTTASASVTVEVTAGVPTEETLLKTLNMEGEITVPEGVTCLKIIVNTTSGMPVPFIDIKVRWN